MPCVLGYNVWSGITPLGAGSTILDLEDFIVSNNLLPLGSLVYLLFCTTKLGWGYENFLKETNTGKGMKFPRQNRVLCEIHFAADRPVYLCDGILYKILCIKRYLVKRSFELVSWCHIL